MAKTFNYYADPQHGWLKVPRKLVNELGIAELISFHSYQRGFDVYLECDADAEVFIEAYKARHGAEPKIKGYHSNKSSKVRAYQMYTPTV